MLYYLPIQNIVENIVDSIQNILKNQIHLIDCMEVLKQLPDECIDSIITDPPYMSTNFAYDMKASKDLDIDAWFKEIIRVAKPNAPIVIFSSGKFMLRMMKLGEPYFRYELIWIKDIMTGVLDSQIRPLRCHETILIFTKTFKRGTVKYNSGVLIDKSINIARANENRHSMNGGKRGIEYKRLNDVPYPKSCIQSNKNNHNNPQLSHPSEKPFELIEKLVKMYSNKGDLVLDTFGGSGVVAHVCKYHKRDFIVCEIDIKYYNMSITRLNSDMLI